MEVRWSMNIFITVGVALEYRMMTIGPCLYAMPDSQSEVQDKDSLTA